MAARGISSHKVPHFPTTLASAALEWLLIFLLFCHAIFSYLITKFARYCNLQVPCLLCSRLDHVLGSEKLGFYWDLICRHHKLEISSLVVCHVHNKLVDVHGMCENCLFSFATINKSNAETYRLLVGKLGEDFPAGLDEDPLEDHKHGDFNKRLCSCCNETFILNNHAQNLLQSHFDFEEKSRKEPTEALKGYDPLPHVEYSKVKNFSDTESEVPFSDDDDGIALIRESKRDFVVQSVPVVPRVITQPDDLISEKFINTDSMSELSLIDMQGLISNKDLDGSNYVSSSMAIGHGLEEISWLHVEPNADSSLAAIMNSESFEEIPQESNVIVTQVQESKLCVDGTETVDQMKISCKNVTYEESMPVIERQISLEIPYAVNAKVTGKIQLEQMSSEEVTAEETKPVIEREASPEIPFVVKDKITETIKSEQLTIEKVSCEEIKPVIEREASLELPSVVNDNLSEIVEVDKTVSEKATHEEIKPVIDREASPEITSVVNDKVAETIEDEAEQISSEKITHEDTKPGIERGPSSEMQSVVNDSISQVPDNLEIGEAYKLAVGNNRRQLSGKLFEQRSLKDSTRISEDFKLLLSQISSSRGIDLPFEFSPRLSGNVDEMGTQIPQRRISLERNESGLSLDGSVIGEIEGESEVDRLKRQVEHDKRLMSALYKELEEERSASGIAANQAMAMITRLQEEKASLQMEALQCVRMMEEQAEYDVEALQKANDLLAEKEKEMQDLEADLEFFRNKLENISMLEREMESREFKAEQSDSSHSKNSENVESNSTVDKPQTFGKDDLTYNSCSEFEDERLYVLQSLRKLEKKLHLFSNDWVNVDVVDTEQTREDKEGALKEPNYKELTQEINSREEENDCGEPCYSQVSRTPKAVAIADEVSNMIKRLEALEADRNGFDHSFTSLKRGDEEIELQSGDSLSQQGSTKE